MPARRPPALALLLLLAGCAEPLPPPPAIEGPPCPSLNPADFTAQGRRTHTTQFNDVTVRYRGGHRACRAFRDASVCWFSSPGAVHVRRKDSEWWFSPGKGQRLIVAVEKGGARCVIDRQQSAEEWAAQHMQPPRPFE